MIYARRLGKDLEPPGETCSVALQPWLAGMLGIRSDGNISFLPGEVPYDIRGKYIIGEG